MSKEAEIKLLEIEIRKLKKGRTDIKNQLNTRPQFASHIQSIDRQIEKLENNIEILKAS